MASGCRSVQVISLNSLREILKKRPKKTLCIDLHRPTPIQIRRPMTAGLGMVRDETKTFLKKKTISIGTLYFALTIPNPGIKKQDILADILSADIKKRPPFGGRYAVLRLTPRRPGRTQGSLRTWGR